MKFEKKISNIPLFMATIIAFCVMLPAGLFIIADDYFKMDESLKSMEERYRDGLKNELKNRSEGFIKFIESRESQTMDSTRSILKKRVEWAKSVFKALSSGLLEKNHGIADDEALKHTCRDVLRELRIDGESEGYFFALDKDTGASIVYPPAPAKEHTFLPFLKDTRGNLVNFEIIKKSGGYLTYNAPKIGDDSGTPYLKISYVDVFRPLGWIIGTGAYVDEIEKQIKDEAILLISDIELSSIRHVVIIDSNGKTITGTRNSDTGHDSIPIIDSDQLKDQMIKSKAFPDGAYAEYYITDQETGTKKRYLGFVKYFEPWDWYIISGNETENISQFITEKKKEIKEKFARQIIYLSCALFFIIAFAISLGSYFKTQTKVSFRIFMDFFKIAGISYEHINVERLKFHELMELGRFANTMVDQRLKQEKIITAYTKGLLGANKKLKSMANMDSMTGIANRRHFGNAIQKEWSRSVRSSKIMSVALLDVDFFKQYNDIYGHPAGDECLRKIASAMMAGARRSYDLVARYGGEEFVILFPETDRNGAITVAKKISDNLRDFNVPHAMNPAGRVTFSMGIASMEPSASERPETLLKLADIMLYKAKKNGRNRICIDDGREMIL